MPESADRPGRPDRSSGGTGGSGRPARPGQSGRPGSPARSSQPPRAGDRPTAAGSGRSAPPAGARRPASREEIAQRAYDPRREERRKAIRVPLPDDVDPRELDAEARRELRSLTKETAELVARHLVMTGRLIDEDPQQALAHARAARALAGRVGVVREGAGLAAYAAGEWSEALSELRAARRITGSPEHLAVFADCERGLGRPERALAYADDPQVAQLSQEQRVELVIVLAGARRDLGQPDAAVVLLQDPARRTTDRRAWAARLWYAYADALLAAGREEQAAEWFAKAAAADVDGETDAGDRLLALEGVVLDDGADLEQAEPRTDLPSEAELADLVAGIPALSGTRTGSADDIAVPTGSAAAAGSGDAAAERSAAQPSAAEPTADAESGSAQPSRIAQPGFRAAAPAPAEDEAQRSRGPVAPPPFAAPEPTADDRDDAEDEELRLFD